MNGVNIYSDGGLETIADSTFGVQLEVRCTDTRELKGGRENQYCVCGPSGEVCDKVALEALWVPSHEVPSIVALS